MIRVHGAPQQASQDASGLTEIAYFDFYKKMSVIIVITLEEDDDDDCK